VPPATTADGRRFPVRPAAAAALVGVVCAVVQYVLHRNEWFVFDDWLYFVLGRQGGYSWDWLNRDLFQHWEPASRAFDTFVQGTLGLDWRLILGAFAALLAGAVVLFERALTLLVGARWVTLAACVWVGLAVTLAAAFQWLSFGQQAITTLFFDLLVLYAYLRHRRDGGWAWLAVAAVALAIGLAFYVRVALMIPYLLGLRVLVLQADLHPRAVLRDLWRERVTWLVLLVPVVAYAILLKASGALDYGSDPPDSVAQVLEFVQISWARNFGPSLVGVHFGPGDTSVGDDLATIAGQLLVVGLVAVSVWRRRSAARVWVLGLLAFALGLATVALPRIGQFGTGIAYDVRYLSDLIWLFPFLAALALAPVDPARPPAALPARLPRPTWRVAVPAVAAVAAFAGVALATAHSMVGDWPGVESRHFTEQWRRSTAALPAGAVTADRETPGFVLQDWTAPYNRLSFVAPIAVPAATIDGPLRGPLVQLDDDGRTTPATFAPAAVSGPRSWGIAPPETAVAGRPGCVVAPAGVAATTGWTPPQPVGQPGERVYLVATASAPTPVAATVFVDVGSGLPAVTDRNLRLAAGPGRSIAFLGAGPVHAVRVDVPGGRSACLTRLALGTLR
jgi:hypothetical protein